MKKIIHLRQSPNWERENEESFLNQKFMRDTEYWNKKIQILYPLIKWWNQSATISYFQFRQKIKNICVENIKKTSADLFFFEENQIETHDQEELFLLCMDDDDWVVSDVFDILQNEMDEKHDIFVWNDRFINSHGRHICRSNNDIYTNNFALSCRGIKKLRLNHPNLKNPEFNPCYWISEQVKKLKFSIKKINKEMSATNKTLASATSLEVITSKKQLLKEISLISSLYNQNNDLWSFEYQKMKEITNQLKLKINVIP